MTWLSDKIWGIALAVLLVGFSNHAGAVEAGDTCDEAGELTEDGSHNFDTTDASGDHPCAPTAEIRTVWYRFTAPEVGRVHADLCGSTFDTYLIVFAGDSCPDACVGIVVEDDQSCDPDITSLTSAVSFNVTEGTTYYFAVSGWGPDDFGAGVFNFTFTPGIAAGDFCAEAGEIIENGSYLFDTTGASADYPCIPEPPTVYYQFTAPENGRVDADLCGSLFDTFLVVHFGDSCPDICQLDNIIAFDDQSCDPGLASAVSFGATEGTTYYFAVSGSGPDDFGAGVFNFSFTPLGISGGDTCAEATEITEDGPYLFTMGEASFDDPCIEPEPSLSTVWYRYTATETALVQADTCGFEATIVVYRGPDCHVECPGLAGVVDFTSTPCELVEFVAVPGETFYFAITGQTGGSSSVGQFRITTTSPINGGDSCTESLIIYSDGAYPFDSTGASEDGVCLSDAPTLWYFFTSFSGGKVIVDTLGSEVDHEVAVFPAGAFPVRCPETCSEYLAIGQPGLRAAFQASPGVSYFITVTAVSEPGPGVMNLSQGLIPVGETCEDPIVIERNGAHHFDNTAVIFDPSCGVGAAPTTWFEFVAPSDGVVDATTCGSPFPTLLAVYEGEACPTSCSDVFAIQDDTCGFFQSIIQYEVEAGTTYRMAVNDYSLINAGEGVLNFTFTPFAGDTCPEAGVIIGNGLYPYDTTDHPDGTDPCVPQIRPAWFRFQAPEDGVVVASLDDTANAPFLRVFHGENCPVSCANVVASGNPVLRPGGKVVFEVLGGDTYLFSCSFSSILATGSGVFNFRFIPSGGDITNDGVINVADVTEFARLLESGVELPLSVADFNNDGVVDELDVQALAEMIVELEPLL